MLDLKLIEEKTDYVIDNLKIRNFDVSAIDVILSLNTDRKKLLGKVEERRAKIKLKSKEVGALKREGKDADLIMAEVTNLKKENESDDKTLETV
ncbi:MAG: seryl-tRNA synthetase, partial [Thermoproteota archaeon]